MESVLGRRGKRAPTVTERRNAAAAREAEQQDRERLWKTLAPVLGQHFKDMRDWERARIQRFGQLKDDAIHTPLQPTETSGWAGLPAEVLALILKYCVTHGAAAAMVAASGGSFYGATFEDQTTEPSALLSEAEYMDFHRLCEAHQNQEPGAEARVAASERAADAKTRMLSEHAEKYADVRGGKSSVVAEGKALPTFTAQLCTARFWPQYTLFCDGKCRRGRDDDSGDVACAEHESAVRRLMSRVERARDRNMRARWDECAAIERAWQPDKNAPKNVMFTCKAWRAAVLDTCPHLLAYPLSLALKEYRWNPMSMVPITLEIPAEFDKFSTAPAAARACIDIPVYPPFYEWPDELGEKRREERRLVDATYYAVDEFRTAVDVVDAPCIVQRMLLFPRLETLILSDVVVPPYLISAMMGKVICPSPSLRGGVFDLDAPPPLLHTCSNLRNLSTSIVRRCL